MEWAIDWDRFEFLSEKMGNNVDNLPPNEAKEWLKMKSYVDELAELEEFINRSKFNPPN